MKHLLYELNLVNCSLLLAILARCPGRPPFKEGVWLLAPLLLARVINLVGGNADGVLGSGQVVGLAELFRVYSFEGLLRKEFFVGSLGLAVSCHRVRFFSEIVPLFWESQYHVAMDIKSFPSEMLTVLA